MPFKPQPFFTYQHLDRSRDSFRLCRLLPGTFEAPVRCELIHDNITDRAGQYCALSYVWGKPTEHRWIFLDEKPFLVQPNLLAGLKAVRKVESALLLWIDAICIYQLLVAERTHQVSLMGQIYRNAEEVLAWLGPEADDSNLAIQYAKDFYDLVCLSEENNTNEQYRGSEFQEEAGIRAFEILSKRPYWSRAWIKQEIILARKITVYCGTESTDCSHLMTTADFKHVTSSVDVSSIYTLYTHRKNMEKKGPERLEELLYRYGRMECADPRDGVFSLLSLASKTQGTEELMPDYSLKEPAIFFALLDFVKPKDITRFADTLQQVLRVRRWQLLEYWNRIGKEGKCPKGASPMEDRAYKLIWRVKRDNRRNFHKRSPFRWLRERLPLKRSRPLDDQLNNREGFLGRFYQGNLMEGDPAKRELFQIGDTMFCIIATPSLFGHRFRGITFHPAFSSIGHIDRGTFSFKSTPSSAELEPFVLLPEVLLGKVSALVKISPRLTIFRQRAFVPGLWEPDAVAYYKPMVAQKYGDVVVNQDIEMITFYILFELDRRAGRAGISLDDCRYLLAEMYSCDLHPVLEGARRNPAAYAPDIPAWLLEAFYKEIAEDGADAPVRDLRIDNAPESVMS